MPTPPAAPCTRSRSPIVSRACVNSASWAVVTFSGIAPACSQGRVDGTGMAARSCTTNRSAWPPPASTAITRSPTAKRVAPRPIATTSPAASSPGMSAGTPGGGG